MFLSKGVLDDLKEKPLAIRLFLEKCTDELFYSEVFFINTDSFLYQIINKNPTKNIITFYKNDDKNNSNDYFKFIVKISFSNKDLIIKIFNQQFNLINIYILHLEDFNVLKNKLTQNDESLNFYLNFYLDFDFLNLSCFILMNNFNKDVLLKKYWKDILYNEDLKNDVLKIDINLFNKLLWDVIKN